MKIFSKASVTKGQRLTIKASGNLHVSNYSLTVGPGGTTRYGSSGVGSGVSAGGDVDEAIDTWLASRGRVVHRCQQVLADLKAFGSPDFTMLSVAMRELRAMQVAAKDGDPGSN